MGFASTARAQTPPPDQTQPAPAAPAPAPEAAPPAYAPPSPPAYAPPAPGYAPPPPGYAPPPPGYAPPPSGYAPPPPGYAPPPPGYAPPGYGYAPGGVYGRRVGVETHDGVYVRLHLGGGFTSMKANSGGADLKISGDSVSIGIAVGGALTENLVLYGTFTGTTISNPNFSSAGTTVIAAGVSTAGSVGFGVGLAYYLEPTNVYFAGSLLANQLELDDADGNKVRETEFGVGFEGLIGKEWWVSDNWGLGVAGQFVFASMKDKDSLGTGNPPTWTSTAFSLLFSATFN
jgi:hypothetical protein